MSYYRAPLWCEIRAGTRQLREQAEREVLSCAETRVDAISLLSVFAHNFDRHDGTRFNFIWITAGHNRAEGGSFEHLCHSGSEFHAFVQHPG